MRPPIICQRRGILSGEAGADGGVRRQADRSRFTHELRPNIVAIARAYEYFDLGQDSTSALENDELRTFRGARPEGRLTEDGYRRELVAQEPSRDVNLVNGRIGDDHTGIEARRDTRVAVHAMH